MTGPTPAELRDMVRRYRAQDTSPEQRQEIQAIWAELGIANQFAALLRAADLERSGGEG